MRSRVLHGQSHMPVDIHHCRVRHRSVLYVGLVAEASNFFWLAFFTQQKTLKQLSCCFRDLRDWCSHRQGASRERWGSCTKLS